LDFIPSAREAITMALVDLGWAGKARVGRKRVITKILQ
jgi:hypothetical protein